MKLVYDTCVTPHTSPYVIPAQAGNQAHGPIWIPFSNGMPQGKRKQV